LNQNYKEHLQNEIFGKFFTIKMINFLETFDSTTFHGASNETNLITILHANQKKQSIVPEKEICA